MNIIQKQVDKNKIAVAFIYLPSLIQVNLVPLVTMSADGEITVIYALTEPKKRARLTIIFSINISLVAIL